MSIPPIPQQPRTITDPRLRVTTDPNIQVPDPNQQAPVQAVPPSTGGGGTPHGITIPQWLIQLLPLIILVFGAATIYAKQNADVEQLKSEISDLRGSHNRNVTKDIFDVRMETQAAQNKRVEDKLDAIDQLIRGLYERMPKKKE